MNKNNLRPNLSKKYFEQAVTDLKGLDDFGETDFIEPLELIIEDTISSSKLSKSGFERFEQALVHQLKNRLCIEYFSKKYSSEVDQLEIKRPMKIIGFPRTGSTFLHSLLSCDPAAHSPLFWEMLTPCPKPELWGKGQADGRLKLAYESERGYDTISKFHRVKAQGPEECPWLFMASFSSPFYLMNANRPLFSKWYQSHSLIPEFQYHRKQIKLILLQRPAAPGSHLLFKSPTHLQHFSALQETYPDASLVHLTRTIEDSVSSMCSFAYGRRTVDSDSVDKNEIGRFILEWYKTGVRNSFEKLSKLPQERIFNVNYANLLKEPVETIRQIYKHFGYSFSPEFESGMIRWLAENPQHKHGVHHHNLEEFGLTSSLVRKALHEYCEKFKV